MIQNRTPLTIGVLIQRETCREYTIKFLISMKKSQMPCLKYQQSDEIIVTLKTSIVQNSTTGITVVSAGRKLLYRAYTECRTHLLLRQQYSFAKGAI